LAGSGRLLRRLLAVNFASAEKCGSAAPFFFIFELVLLSSGASVVRLDFLTIKISKNGEV